MKYTEERGVPVIELTRRNLEVLLAKLDDPDSRRQLVIRRPDGGEAAVRAIEDGDVAAIRAVENNTHYANRPPGEMLVNGEII